VKIVTKEFQNFPVRILLLNEKEWFVAKDVATLLDYKDTKKAIQQHCKKAVAIGSFFKGDQEPPLNFQDIFGNNWKQTKLIPESDVWRLIIKSRLPEAEKIEEWIMEEVLPSIRKTGSYSLQEKENVQTKPEYDFEAIQKVVKIGIEFLNEFDNLNPVKQIKLDNFVKNRTEKSLLEDFGISFENSYFLPTEIGNMIGMSGAEINLILEKKGFQFRDENGVWKPTEKGFDFCLEIGNKFNQLKWRISTIL
jgi:prophage antirepressor-like protein